MLVTLWIINILLALAFLAAGTPKLLRPKPALVDSGMGWAENFPAAGIKFIGTAEVLGAIGLIVPLATDVAPVLTPIAAVCLIPIMIGAVATHLRRKEKTYTGPLALAILAAVSAVLGFATVL